MATPLDAVPSGGLRSLDPQRGRTLGRTETWVAACRFGPVEVARPGSCTGGSISTVVRLLPATRAAFGSVGRHVRVCDGQGQGCSGVHRAREVDLSTTPTSVRGSGTRG